MTIHAKETVAAVLSFTASAILLTDLLIKSDKMEHASYIFEQAKNRLEAEKSLHFHDQEALICIKACVTSLLDGIRFHQSHINSVRADGSVSLMSDNVAQGQKLPLH